MKKFWAIFLGWYVVACLPDAASPSEVRDLTTHKRACTAKGEVIIEKDLMDGEPCAATDLRLRALVATDEDCRAYYGDAGVKVDLCGPKRPALDGGAE